MRSTRIFGAAAVIMGFMAAIWSGPAAAADKEPPSCAAITFRPVPSGLTDGEQDAGLYKSRFGKIEVKATVKSGEAQNYFVVVNGKPLSALTGGLPASVSSCAKAKRFAAVGNPPAICMGDKLAVVIDHAGDKRYVLFYAHHNGEWHFCSAGGA